MEKRKLRLNILDVTIVVVTICAMVALIFRNDINDAFNKPEIVTLEVNISADNGDDNIKSLFTVGNMIFIDFINQSPAVVMSAEFGENSSNAVLHCNGYLKLGRYYTENGDLIEVGSDVAAGFGETRLVCKVTSVSESSK